MAPPVSAARALHDLIAEVQGRFDTPNITTAYHAWGSVVGDSIETATFARFHAEVVTLLREVTEDLTMLSPSAQQRYSQYLPHWWTAVVLPRKDWATDGTFLIGATHLDLLGSLADVMESRALSVGPSNPQTVDILKQGVSFLLNATKGANDLPAHIQDQIVADLEHVLWLLDHVDTFGVDHTVAAMEKVTGKAVAEAAKAPTSGLKRVAIGLVATLALLAPATTDVTTIVGNVRSAFGVSAAPPEQEGEDVVQSTVVEIYTVCTTKQLTAGPADADGGEVVDAEVVDEDAGEGAQSGAG